MILQSKEINFDGLVGPTHNYAGLSLDNRASASNKALTSNPLEAVLQGLEKMRTLADEGFAQAVLPPHERPSIEILKTLGFTGKDEKILRAAAKEAPHLLAAASSASAMWTANAVTVSPSTDTADGKVHFTPANLVSKWHRSIETPTTSRLLKKIFKDQKFFAHHDPLPATPAMGDEGAANHTRFCKDYGSCGVAFFVYGSSDSADFGVHTRRFIPRQSLEASHAVARQHGLDKERVVFAQQSPEAIDAGVFHNDVVAVGNQHFYFYHEKAYVDSRATVEEIRQKLKKQAGLKLCAVEVLAREVSLKDAIKSYLFNSQILTKSDGSMILIAPSECQKTPSVSKYLEKLLRNFEQPLRGVKFFDLRQSMRNGGGPACLRLRVVLNQTEMKAMNRHVFMNHVLHTRLTSWAKKHYRDRLFIGDLADPHLLTESRYALDKLTQILHLGSIYSFQR